MKLYVSELIVRLIRVNMEKIKGVVETYSKNFKLFEYSIKYSIASPYYSYI